MPRLGSLGETICDYRTIGGATELISQNARFYCTFWKRSWAVTSVPSFTSEAHFSEFVLFKSSNMAHSPLDYEHPV